MFELSYIHTQLMNVCFVFFWCEGYRFKDIVFSCSKDDPDNVATCSEILNQSEQEVARILGPEILSGIPGGQDSMKLDNTGKSN